jgi:hypothetical protein
MNQPEPGTSQHGKHRFGDHWEINQDSITAYQTQRSQHVGKLAYFVIKVAEGVGAFDINFRGEIVKPRVEQSGTLGLEFGIN